jgi:Tfp pilus assembly protein FimT
MKPISAKSASLRWRLKKVHSERGTTLVELLVAMSISVLVIGIISTSLVQFFLVTIWGNDQLRITNDLQVASLWLGRDALESANFTPGTGAVYGTLNWDDSTNQYRYSYNSGDGTLVREHFEDSILLSTLQVARHITNQGDVVFSTSGQLLTVSITSTSGDESESVNLSLAMRSQ